MKASFNGMRIRAAAIPLFLIAGVWAWTFRAKKIAARRVIECVSRPEFIGTPLTDRQMAVWIVSDGLLKAAPDELFTRFVGGDEKGFAAPVDGAFVSDVLRKWQSRMPPEILRQIRETPPEAIRPAVIALVRTRVLHSVQAAEPMLRGCGYDTASSRLYRGAAR